MKKEIELVSEAIKAEFGEKDEQEALMLYEFLGRELCKIYKFNYIKMLEMMLKRAKNRAGC